MKTIAFILAGVLLISAFAMAAPSNVSDELIFEDDNNSQPDAIESPTITENEFDSGKVTEEISEEIEAPSPQVLEQNPEETLSGNDGSNPQTGAEESSVHLSVKEWYPKGNHYVFICDTKGFKADTFSWFYDDGHKLIDIKNQDTYHIYTEEGSYEVKCVAKNGEKEISDTLKIEVVVKEPSESVEEAPSKNALEASSNESDTNSKVELENNSENEFNNLEELTKKELIELVMKLQTNAEAPTCKA